MELHILSIGYPPPKKKQGNRLRLKRYELRRDQSDQVLCEFIGNIKRFNVNIHVQTRLYKKIAVISKPIQKF